MRARYNFTEEDKLRILIEVDDCCGNREKIKALLDREGINLVAIYNCRYTLGFTSKRKGYQYRSPEEKLQILEEWSCCSKLGEVKTIVVREGVCRSLLSKWRQRKRSIQCQVIRKH